MNEFHNVEFTTKHFGREIRIKKGPGEDHITSLALTIKVEEGEDYISIKLGNFPNDKT